MEHSVCACEGVIWCWLIYDKRFMTVHTLIFITFHNEYINGDQKPTHVYRTVTLWWAIWRDKSEATLIDVMACSLVTPSHYPNQCWPWISKVRRHSSGALFSKICLHRQSLKLAWKLLIWYYMEIFLGPLSEVHSHFCTALYAILCYKGSCHNEMLVKWWEKYICFQDACANKTVDFISFQLIRVISRVYFCFRYSVGLLECLKKKGWLSI